MFYSSDLTYTVISLGCSKNLVDSERINGDMAAAGFSRADSIDSADIIIVNTCGFITPAKEESIEALFDASTLAERSGEGADKPFGTAAGVSCKKFRTRTVAVGCLTKRYRRELVEEMPEIDLIYGIPDEKFTARLCRAFDIEAGGEGRGRRAPIVEGLSYSYLKISDGCSNRCSYCAIPLIRGRNRSFPLETILRDANDAVALGAVELDIVAQDIAAYRHGGLRLENVIESVSRIEGLKWIRLLYCHPDHLDGRIIRAVAENAKVAKYIDIPFQHASGRILRSMGRKGDAESHLALIGRLRDAVPGIRIRSTFMVGYPGEEEEDFGELMAFLKAAAIDKAGAFSYSPEEGTAAAALKDGVPDKLKRDRYRKLMALQRKISAGKLEGMIGTTVPVLVEERLDERTFLGRSEYDAPEVDGIFYLTARDARIKSIVPALVTGAAEYDLYGEPV